MNEPNNPISPKHYSGPNGVECRDILKHVLKDSPFPDQYTAHCWATAFTYLFRCGRKGDWKEDMQKAVRFLEFAIQDGRDWQKGLEELAEIADASGFRVGARVRVNTEDCDEPQLRDWHGSVGVIESRFPSDGWVIAPDKRAQRPWFKERHLQLLPETEVKA